MYGNCTALFESPMKEGLIYVGTDDGLIHVTQDGGSTWTKIEKFSGVPERTYVSRVMASQHDVNTVYAAFDNHKNADFAPYLLKSTDAGQSWESVAGNLPANGPVLAIAEDHVNRNLLFAGTEFGLFFSIDGGTKWIQLKSGLPIIAVRDLAIQKRENDLVAATFGRGFYILDDYTPLRTLKPEMLAGDALTFPVKDAPMFILAQPLGGSRKADQGESFFTAPNPPFGATVTYYLKDALKTSKDIRREAEKEAEKKKQPVHYPTPEELRAEDEEEAPAIILTITDSDGNVVRKLTGSNSQGINRTTWDLRYPLPTLSSAPPPGNDEPSEGGALVMPGKYTVTLAKQVSGVVTQLGEPQTFNVVVPGQAAMQTADRKALVEFQQKAARLQRAFHGAVQVANEVKSRLGTIKHALQETAAPVDNLVKDELSIENRLASILRALQGDGTMRSRNENSPVSIGDRVNRVMEDGRTSTSRPTQTDIDAYTMSSESFAKEVEKLRALVDVDLAGLEKAMEKAGSPWTPGRFPEWKQE